LTPYLVSEIIRYHKPVLHMRRTAQILEEASRGQAWRPEKRAGFPFRSDEKRRHIFAQPPPVTSTG
jgi:hypothetical protein